MKISKGKALKTQTTVNNKLYHIVVVKFTEIGYSSFVTDDWGNPVVGYPKECWDVIQQLREKLG